MNLIRTLIFAALRDALLLRPLPGQIANVSQLDNYD
jgi:hypothetical protein